MAIHRGDAVALRVLEVIWRKADLRCKAVALLARSDPFFYALLLPGQARRCSLSCKIER
jgi:hypothetical protein